MVKKSKQNDNGRMVRVVEFVGLVVLVVVVSVTVIFLSNPNNKFDNRSEAAGTNVPSHATCPCYKADLNGDGYVSLLDFSSYAACQGKSLSYILPNGISCSKADTNNDGVIDQKDYVCIQSNFGTQCAPDVSCTCDKADLNNDGYVTLLDFSAFSACQGKPISYVLPNGIPCRKADTNGDGIIDQRDFYCLQSQFGKQCRKPVLSCNSPCRFDSDCSTGYCFQPPMPKCPSGRACPQVMPVKVCRNQNCPSTTDCSCTPRNKE